MIHRRIQSDPHFAWQMLLKQSLQQQRLRCGLRVWFHLEGRDLRSPFPLYLIFNIQMSTARGVHKRLSSGSPWSQALPLRPLRIPPQVESRSWWDFGDL